MQNDIVTETAGTSCVPAIFCVLPACFILEISYYDCVGLILFVLSLQKYVVYHIILEI